jgi:hypothetical protein
MLHATTIALGACLLFLIQPLLGRQLLPWMGGSAGVWSACLVTFQFSLLAGYLYAHQITSRSSTTVQRCLHLGLLAASLLFPPAVTTSFAARPPANIPPTLAIVVWILVSAGLPLLLLSASSPLLSVWYRESPGSKSVYRLYALSNAGSLLAVFGYPLLIEPYFTLQQQRVVWSAAYALYAVITAVVALRPREHTANAPPTAVDGPPGAARWLWFTLAMCGTAMLTATTNLVSQEIAVVPFLWLAPLGIYLLTLIVAFDHPRWYRRSWWMMALALAALPQCAVLYAGAKLPFLVQVGVSLTTLLAASAVCHGELSHARPGERRLTDYYLVIAAGGCAGGMFVAVAAPLIFNGYWEYHVSLWGSCLLAALAAHSNRAWNLSSRPELRLVVGTGLVALAVILIGEAWAGELHARVTRRSFYGVLRLVDGTDGVGPFRKLAHGRIAHGLQYVDEDKQDWATLYFGRRSGVGITFEHLRTSPVPLRVGLVGLGTGTIAVYGRPGDVFRFYEINPDVDWFAREHFTFVSRSRAHVETVLGDARVSLEQEFAAAGSQQYDLLIVDAFRNDAIPVHLLTRECGATYFRHLKEGGALLFHISNRFIDLEPVVRGLAAAHDLTAVHIHAGFEPERGAESVTWMVVTRNTGLRERLAAADETPGQESTKEVLWTDDFSALWPLIE